MKPLLPVLILLLFLPLLVLAVRIRQSVVPRASNNADPQSWTVKINPEIIAAVPNGQPVYLSTLLVDSDGQPVPMATSYEWHISANASPGRLEPNGNLATFTPLATGSADLIVKATNINGTFLGSAPIITQTISPPTPVHWKSRTSWLKADYFYFTLGGRDVGERIFSGRPDPGTTVKIDEAATNTLAVSWREWGVPLTLSVYYDSVAEFDSEKTNYVISGLTISDGVVTDTYRPVWNIRAGYPFTTAKEEALLPVKQSHPNLVGVLTFKNIYWHPGIYPTHDLDYAKWSWKHVQKILPTRIMTPVADGLFDPEGEITRASMATFLIRTYEYITGRSVPEDETPFTDINELPPDVQTAIRKIYGLKISAGTSATTYSPEIKTDRAQMATFLSNLYKAVYGEYAPEVPVPFTDIGGEDIKWAQKHIARIYGLKITTGISPTEFGPYLVVTREQMATFISRFIEAVQEKPLPIVSPTPSPTPIPPIPLPTTGTPTSTITPSPAACVDTCGDGVCQSLVCQGEGCVCAESAASCPSDCGATPAPTPKPTPDVERLTQTFSDLTKALVSPPPVSPVITSSSPPTPSPVTTPALEIPPEASPAQVSIFVQIITLIQNFFQSLFK